MIICTAHKIIGKYNALRWGGDKYILTRQIIWYQSLLFFHEKSNFFVNSKNEHIPFWLGLFKSNDYLDLLTEYNGFEKILFKRMIERKTHNHIYNFKMRLISRNYQFYRYGPSMDKLPRQNEISSNFLSYPHGFIFSYMEYKSI